MKSGREAFQISLGVSRETMRRFDTYAKLLLDWNKRINLVAKGTEDDLWTRHFLDSGQLSSHLANRGGALVDIGSGAGFPGAVLALLTAGDPGAGPIVLIEADKRKAAFLRTMSRETGVPLTVLAERSEQAPPQNASLLTSRAMAPLTGLLEHASRHLAPDGEALFPKGRTAREEVQDALADWSFRCETFPSRTKRDAVILKVGGIHRV